MSKKRVTFEYVFEYDEENLDEFSDEHVEKIAFQTLADNIHDLGMGEVELIEE